MKIYKNKEGKLVIDGEGTAEIKYVKDRDLAIQVDPELESAIGLITGFKIIGHQ